MKKSILLLFLLCSNLVFAQSETPIGKFGGFEFGQPERMVKSLLATHGVEYTIDDELSDEKRVVIGQIISLYGVTFDGCIFSLSNNKLQYGVFLKKDTQDVVLNVFAKLKSELVKKYGEGITGGETENVWIYNIGFDNIVLGMIPSSSEDEAGDSVGLSLSFERVNEQ